MAYKKPQMVAKSSAKKSYVAGCPVKTVEREIIWGNTYCSGGERCELANKK